MNIQQFNPTSASKDAYEFTGTRQMNVDDFIDLQSNPRQRNTELRAQTAKKKHLKNYDAIHAKVMIGVLPDGSHFKLDGHTRSFLWKSGELDRPDGLIAEFWWCKDLEALKDLYSRIDSSLAVETSNDKFYGAAREHSLNFKSSYMRNNKFAGGANGASALLKYGNLHHGTRHPLTAPEVVDVWKQELIVMDTLSLSPKKFPKGVTIAFLLGARIYGDHSLRFWDDYNRGLGSKIGRELDAIQALDSFVELRRRQARLTQREHVLEVARASSNALSGYMKNKTYKALMPMASKTFSNLIATVETSTIRFTG